MDRPDVFLFIGQLEGGGAEKHCLDLARAFRGLGIAVRVVGTQAAPETLLRYAGAGVPVSLVGSAPLGARKLSLFSPGRARRFLRRWNDLRRLLKRERPFLVHAFLPYANLAALSVKPWSRFPVLVAGHRYAGSAGILYNLSQAAEAVFCRFCELNLANSRDVASFLVGKMRLPAEGVSVAVNGISCETVSACAGARDGVRGELQLKDGDIAAAMVSNLWPYKGIGDFQRAVAAARQRNAKLRAFLVGRDVGTLAGFQEESRRLGIEDCFQFLGARSDVCRLLRGFDIYVSASRGEGMSNAVLEAMAHGLPVVGSRAAGTSELLDDGRAGRLFEPGDWRVLSGHLMDLAGSKEERSRLGRAAWERVCRDFSIARMVTETLQAYAKASRRHPRAADYFSKKAREAASEQPPSAGRGPVSP